MLQAYDQRRAAKEAAREAEERKLEEEIARLQAERDAADAAEAEQWMGQISVEGGGTGEDAEKEAQVGVLVPSQGNANDAWN